MFFALCPGPFFSAEEVYGLLMSAASYLSLLALALLALLKLADARRRRSARRYSHGLNSMLGFTPGRPGGPNGCTNARRY